MLLFSLFILVSSFFHSVYVCLDDRFVQNEIVTMWFWLSIAGLRVEVEALYIRVNLHFFEMSNRKRCQSQEIGS